jgi:PEP-CTERM motif
MSSAVCFVFRAALVAVAAAANLAPSPAVANTTAFIDRFLILRNVPPDPTLGGLYSDEFSNDLAPVHLVPEPAGGGAFANGALGLYVLTGSFAAGAESGGKLALDPAGGAAVVSGNGMGFFRIGATLATDTTPGTAAGLKPIYDFSVRARFDLVTPAANADGYGIELGDGSPAGIGNDRLQLFVRRNTTGDALIQLVSQRLGPGGSTVSLDADPLAPPAGAAQITLRLNHAAATVGQVLAGYQYVDAAGNVYDPVSGQFTTVPVNTLAADAYTTFLGTGGEIFVDDEGFTRAAFLAVQAVPEPGTYAMLLAGLGMLAWVIRRRMRA